MSTSFVYIVTERTVVPLPVLLRGTTSNPLFRLTALTIITTGSDHTIKKANTADRITVTPSEHTALSNTALPYSISFHGNEQPNGDFIISSFSINTSVVPPAMASTLTSSRLTGTEDS